MPPRDRIQRLRTDVMQRGGSFVGRRNPFARSVALYRAAQPDRSRVQVRAAYLYELVRLAPIEIHADWKIAGNHLPTHGGGWDVPEAREDDHIAALGELEVPAREIPALRETVRRWLAARPGQTGAPEPEDLLGGGGWGQDSPTTVFWANGWVENHSIRDYAKVLRLGFGGIRDDIHEQLQAAAPHDPGTPGRQNFWHAALDVCRAGILLGERHADLAADLAHAAPAGEEAERLTGIAMRCRHVPERGARTFEEAVQSLWLAHILTCGEDGINANSLGRIDQFLLPFYEADLHAGRLTREQAVEIMEELACCLYLDYDVQAITLGGVDADGHDATNALSYAILETTRNVGFVRDLSIRLHSSSPPDFVRQGSALAAAGGGIPFVFNDEACIKALSDRGISVEDARDYAPIGCVELTIPGKANPHAVSGWFNSAKCLELALFNGIDPATGVRLGPPTGELTAHADVEAVFAAYRAQVEAIAPRMVYGCNRGELRQAELGPLPCWSVLTDDCIGRGQDITAGGARYHYHSVCFLGTANTADSLMAIRKLVFEEGRVDPRDLLEALRNNFDGSESLRRMLLTDAPKYGNDCPEVDAYACGAAEHFIELMDGMRSPLGGRFFVHLFSFRCNINFGKTVGAMPDGRRAGAPLAYSLSAHQGRDVNGVTAMLSSLARLPHDRAAGATAAIIELDPALVGGEAGTDRLADLTRAAVAMGIGQLQWNVTSTERLQQAQADPEHYGNIAVRVAGYSQMFKLIDKELQDHIIARTKHQG